MNDEVYMGTVTENVYQSPVTPVLMHISDQLDLMHQTLAINTDYQVWTFGINALIASFVGFLIGYVVARGR